MKTSINRHESAGLASQRVLARARVAKNGYDTHATRQKLKELTVERCGYEPYEWQLDVAEALHLRCDTVVIAPTGAGKTLPFVMPLFIEPEKAIVIVSPLLALQGDQVSMVWWFSWIQTLAFLGSKVPEGRLNSYCCQ